jgi:glycosyltransferase involved in cell wall biosynthesis
LARAAIFVSTALYEPFGLAVLEAARSGCALVLSDIPNFRELWDGAAVFADAQSPSAIAGAVEDLASDPQKRLAMAAAAQKRARRYALDAQAAGILAVYAKARQRQPSLAEAS